MRFIEAHIGEHAFLLSYAQIGNPNGEKKGLKNIMLNIYF